MRIGLLLHDILLLLILHGVHIQQAQNSNMVI